MTHVPSDPPVDPPVDAIEPWRALLLAHNRALRAIEADLRDAGTIPLTWYDVLLELNGAGGELRMQDLADRVVLSRTRVSRLVDELERRELVHRTPDPDDGRSVRACITRAGRTALRAAAPHYLAGIERHFLRHLDDAERQAIERGLGRVVEAHESSQASTATSSASGARKSRSGG